ncbi:MAG TPA: DUF4232 domain-containing protein [Jatrophihabitans sp.]|nr:DUF4232 domain-containing protein [Jatrophihabitans sp.]
MWRRRAAVLAFAALVVSVLAASNQPVQAADGLCRDDALALSIPAQAPFVRGVMGTTIWTVQLRNRSAGRCTLAGWPTLTTRTAASATWSPAAGKVAGTRTAATPQRSVSLAAGESAAVLVSEPAVGSSCRQDWSLSLQFADFTKPLTALVPRGLLGQCPIGTSLTVSRVIPFAQVATAPAAPLTITQQTGIPRCVMSQLGITTMPPQHQGAVTMLVFELQNVRQPCSLPFAMEARLRGADGSGELAAFATSSRAQHLLAAAYPSRDGRPTTLPSGASVELPVSITSTGADCRLATSATLYDSPTDLGTSATLPLSAGVRSCGRPGLFPLLAGPTPGPASPSTIKPSTAQPLRNALAELAQPTAVTPYDTAGFGYGTDSNEPTVSGTAAPYLEPQGDAPTVGGRYAFYSGAIDSYWRDNGCSRAPQYSLAFNQKNKDAADADYALAIGWGANPYYAFAGPGLDPSYGTAAEASSWGSRQAATLAAELNSSYWSGFTAYIDIEDVVNSGWNAVWSTRCGGYGGSELAGSIPASLDLDTYQGITSYIQANTGYYAGIYMAGGSGSNSWSNVFGSNGTGAREWTYENETNSTQVFPSGFAIPGGVSAVFFAGASTSSGNAFAWQWSGGGGTSNGYGDFDQVRD